jgi:hypothetical protein
MTHVDWEMKGPGLGNCNCDYGCPCQFNALPTHGNCEAVGAMHIEQGHYGDVSLDGLSWVALFYWPGPIHEGSATCQAVVDAKAGPEQRNALLTILTGAAASEEAMTFLDIFASTVTDMHEPLFRDISFDINVEDRTARLVVDDVVDTSVEPLRNAVTGETHRARIDLPNGFEFTIAEIASGSTSSQGAVNLALRNSHTHMVNYHLTHQGVVR